MSSAPLPPPAPTAAVDRESSRWAWRESRSPEPHGTIVLLHGLGGSRISWEPQLTGLSSDHLVVAWDLPGYGAAPPPDAPLTFAWLAAAVAAFVDEVAVPDRPVHLVGISFGGMIAQYAAAAHPAPFASLTLLATSPKFGLDGTLPDEWRAARLAPLDAGQEPVDFADAVLGHLAGPAITAEALNGQRAAMARITGAALRRSIDCLITHDSRALLASIRTPTLCLVGALDDETPIAYSEAIAGSIRDAELVVIPGAGHLLNVEAPEAVNIAITAHVARRRVDVDTENRSTP